VAATAAALLLAATPAAAQDDYESVVGGGSFNAAPILEPGRYRDTLLPTEYLYYGFRLEAGQRMHVTANAEMEIEDFQTLVSDITANLHSPTRDRIAVSTEFDNRGNFRVEPEPPLDITGPVASAEDDPNTTGPWTGPGVYYLTFYAIYTGPSDEPPKAEIPFHFEVEVEGEAQATPTPSPSPSPTASPTPTATPEPEDEEDGVSPGLVAGFGAGGLLVGVISGLALRRRRR
jgi:hypothetical protein